MQQICQRAAKDKREERAPGQDQQYGRGQERQGDQKEAMATRLRFGDH